MCNETDEDWEHRLQQQRQNRAIRIRNETDEERQQQLQRFRQSNEIGTQKETDEERQQRLQRLQQNNASRIHNETDEERRRRLEVYRQNDAGRRNDRQQELHDLQNTRERYLSNTWRTAEQPLHQQQWVQNEMAKFHSSIKSGCQRKPGKMLKMSMEGGQQNKFILTS